MNLDKLTVISLFVGERWPDLLVVHYDSDLFVRINRRGSVREDSLVAIYENAIYYMCKIEHQDHYGIELELGIRWNGIWNKVPISIAQPDFFETLAKTVNLALENTATQHEQS